MEYRQFSYGNRCEKFSVLGLGLGAIGQTPPGEIEAVVRKAIACGINFFDMCTAGAFIAEYSIVRMLSEKAAGYRKPALFL